MHYLTSTEVEGKLETLADKIFERFVNRFFDDESEFCLLESC